MLHACRLLVAAALMFVAAGSAQGSVIGFTVYFTGATVTLDNDADFEITQYSITIGDPDFNFDRATTAYDVSGPGSAFVLVSPDTLDDGVRSELLAYTFTDFLPGNRLGSALDIDPDSGNSGCCDIHGVMFNNGAAPNATISVAFSNTQVLDVEIPDQDFATCSVFGDCKFVLGFEVPEPAALLLVGLSAAAFAARRLWL